MSRCRLDGSDSLSVPKVNQTRFKVSATAPLDSDGRVVAAIGQAQPAALARADRVVVRLIHSTALPLPALAAQISMAIKPFAGDRIIEMLVICAFLRRVTVWRGRA